MVTLCRAVIATLDLNGGFWQNLTALAWCNALRLTLIQEGSAHAIRRALVISYGPARAETDRLAGAA